MLRLAIVEDRTLKAFRNGVASRVELDHVCSIGVVGGGSIWDGGGCTDESAEKKREFRFDEEAKNRACEVRTE